MAGQFHRPSTIWDTEPPSNINFREQIKSVCSRSPADHLLMLSNLDDCRSVGCVGPEVEAQRLSNSHATAARRSSRPVGQRSARLRATAASAKLGAELPTSKPAKKKAQSPIDKNSFPMPDNFGYMVTSATPNLHSCPSPAAHLPILHPMITQSRDSSVLLPCSWHHLSTKPAVHAWTCCPRQHLLHQSTWLRLDNLT